LIVQVVKEVRGLERFSLFALKRRKKSSVSIRCKKIFFDSFMKSSAVGISSLGIYLLLFPVAGAEDERDLSAASHSSLFISKNSYSSRVGKERLLLHRLGEKSKG
jgi:hypothetical protein